MLRQILIVVPALGAAVSCFGIKQKQGPDTPTEKQHQTDFLPGEPTPEPVAQEDATPQVEEAEKEAVAPPANIAGAFLVCELTSPVQAGDLEATARCSLRDEKSNSKVDLKTRYANSSWTYEVPAGSSLTVSSTELAASPEWHVSYSIKANDAAVLAAQLGMIQFALNAQDAAGARFKASRALQSPFLQWTFLNGNTVPNEAAPGGTWQGTAAILYLCRIHADNEILPGKLLRHYNDPSKSVCYSVTAAVSAVQSQSEDAQTLLVPNEVLLISQGTFDDYFEWVPATNGQYPANAFVTGRDAQGRPLYSCRGIQNDGALPADQTPGVLRLGSTGCVHEFQVAAQLRTSYQVLTWKTSATSIIYKP